MSKNQQDFISPCFLNSLPRVEKFIKNVQTENIKNFCDLFPFVIFKREILSWMFTEQRSSFFYSNGRDGLLFIIILCCIFGYCVISVLKPAINNPLISECSCDFIH